MFHAYIGIDPGLTGAIGVVTNKYDAAFVYDIPTYKNKKGKSIYDYYGMFKMLNGYVMVYDNVTVSLEQQQAMPGQGVSSTFQTGVGYGAWLAFCWALTPNFERVSPRVWKKALGLTNNKEESRALASKLYPMLADSLKLKKHHNRAEALLLAHYTKELHG